MHRPSEFYRAGRRIGSFRNAQENGSMYCRTKNVTCDDRDCRSARIGQGATFAQCGCANLDKPLVNAAISSLVMLADIH